MEINDPESALQEVAQLSDAGFLLPFKASLKTTVPKTAKFKN